MTSLSRRLQRIEAVMRPVSKPGSDPNRAMQNRALERLSTEDLFVLIDIVTQGRPESEWTERESNAVKALACAYDQEAQSAAASPPPVHLVERKHRRPQGQPEGT
jgi:hypothetical protein